jgi:hypothetical protein
MIQCKKGAKPRRVLWIKPVEIIGLSHLNGLIKLRAKSFFGWAFWITTYFERVQQLLTQIRRF